MSFLPHHISIPIMNVSTEKVFIPRLPTTVTSAITNHNPIRETIRLINTFLEVFILLVKTCGYLLFSITFIYEG